MTDHMQGPISLYLDREMRAEIAEVAARRQISRAAVLRDWLRRGRADYLRELDLIARVRERQDSAI